MKKYEAEIYFKNISISVMAKNRTDAKKKIKSRILKRKIEHLIDTKNYCLDQV